MMIALDHGAELKCVGPRVKKLSKFINLQLTV